MVALSVDVSHIKKVAETINSYAGTTHNYEREGKYNLWFTLLTSNEEREQMILSEIRNLVGVNDMLCLKSNKKYKINVQFKL